MKMIYAIFVFVILSATQLVFAGTLNVTTNKQTYSPGEEITISITASGFPSQLDFPSGCQAYYVMDGTYDSAAGVMCIQIPTSVTLPHTWTKIHDWARYSPGIGTHSVVAYLESPWMFYFPSNCASFTVGQQLPFHLLSPNGGEALAAGSTATIQWYDYESIFPYELAYSMDNGQNWLPIASSVSGNSYAWTIPNSINSSQCLIKATKQSIPAVSDISDNPFTIQVPFKLTAPNGGERFVAGSTATIQWQDYEDNIFYDLQYSADGGQNWQTIVSSIDGDSYEWTTPTDLNSNLCLVEVRKSANPSVADVSDNLFMVFECQGPIDGDLNGDCYVDLFEYSIIAKNWLRSDCTESNQWCDHSDIYQDGVVDILDLIQFAEQWLTCGNPFDSACSS